MTETKDPLNEVAKLREDLERACEERKQAAEYGLEVLSQKDQLQQNFNDLESQYEHLKHEFECAKKVILSSKFIMLYLKTLNAKFLISISNHIENSFLNFKFTES